MTDKFYLEDNDGNAHIKGALNRNDPAELLIGEIHSKEKSRGYGTRLIKALEKLAFSRGAKKSRAVLGQFEDTDLEALRRFYEKNGYQLSETDELLVAHKKLTQP